MNQGDILPTDAFSRLSMANPDLEVRDSSIQGRGVFARRAFGAGEVISRVNVIREVTESAPLRPELGELPEHCADLDGRLLLYGLPDRHFNHSCDPNSYETCEDGKPAFMARRSIEAGEEFTIDYDTNFAGSYSFPCRCFAARCRGVLGLSYFGLPLEVQLEYLPILAPWFLARHRDRIEKIAAKGAGAGYSIRER